MKKSIRFGTLMILTVGILLTSCVSSKKFVASEGRANQLQKENVTTHAQLNECNAQLVKVTDEKATVQKEKADMQAESELMQKEYALIQKNMMTRSTESKMTIADQARRLNNLQDIIDSQKEISSRLKNSIANALMNYKSDELSVYLKDGNVYVSLAEKLLFKSGSDVVDPKGKAALKSLATVLNGSGDFTVAIEGHTDNVPISTKLFEDNWDLSTARATSIVRILTVDNGFDPMRITASGKGQFHPVSTNTTAQERSANRRTEVILSPDLKEIYKLLYQ